VLVHRAQAARVGWEMGPLTLGSNGRPLLGWQVVVEYRERKTEPGGGGRDDPVQTELVGGEADARWAGLPSTPQRIVVERDCVSVLAHAQIEEFVTSTSTVKKRRGPTSSGRIPSTPSTKERRPRR
jgi:hypothetical protein